MDAGADAVARRPLERLRAPAPQSRAAALRRAGAGWRARPDRRPSSRHFLRAHHLGAFAWLVRDRIEDGQVEVDESAARAGRSSSSSAGARRSSTARGTACWRMRSSAAPPRAGSAGRAPRTERAGRRFGAGADLRGDRPGEAGLDRRAVAGAAAGERRPRRVNAFLHAHDLYLVGLQAIDDVIDTDEDRALRGGDVPSALVARRGRWCGWRRSWCSGPPRRPRPEASPGSRRGSTPSRTRSPPGASTAIGWTTSWTPSASRARSRTRC